MRNHIASTSIGARAFRNVAVAGSAAALALLLAFAAVAAEEMTWDAHITDTMCGASHMMQNMTDPECAIACREMGADYALFVASEEKVYGIANPDVVEEFAGTDVVVTGEIGDDGETVTIVSIAARPE